MITTFDVSTIVDTATRWAEWEQVYIRLQPHAAEALALAAGFSNFPPPLPNTTVKVRSEVPCPACGLGRVSRSWRMERRALVAGSGCWRKHVFVMDPPLPSLRAGVEV
ncbi:hypothetical protein [Streptomyces noursei]|uniref:hypothetical protein n=1 Tax=Streptomyces noursei TaxID=1971 RepID=UPI001679247A|nr:hypothetical protein [Streptomyces noursei]MCZ1014431.1 hypothetical protein [Streptomyces noursei]GGW94971.1 hypothetical protein GCM10010341_15170 [Streptomyces noursei]